MRVVLLLLSLAIAGECHKLEHGTIQNILKQYIQEIQEERPVDTLLVIQSNKSHTSQLQTIYQFPLPKVLLRPKHGFYYRTHYNSEILAVIIMPYKMDTDLMQTLAETLNHMRQARMLMLAMDISNRDEFKHLLLQQCEMYKITNVLLKFIQSYQQPTQQLAILKPYPCYRWDLLDTFLGKPLYYPVHWQNLQQKTLLTFADQLMGRTLVYRNPQGELKINGFVARLILLFAERFNASLQMYRPLEPTVGIHYSVLAQMTQDGKLDVPMSLDTLHTSLLYITDYVDLGQFMLVVPCGCPFTVHETFATILNASFFVCILVISVMLSIVHALIESCFYDLNHKLNLVLSDKVLPGVMGQSFVYRYTNVVCLRIIYLLIGFVGVLLAAQFWGHLKTLLAMPPTHQQIRSFDDLRHSQLKILFDAKDTISFSSAFKAIESSSVISNDSNYVLRMRYGFNTTYGYYLTTMAWTFLSWQQQCFSIKSYCTDTNLILYSLLPWGVRLQDNSPYKEPLNFLIHRVHEVGLIAAWHSSTFVDMLKADMISLEDPYPHEGRQVLKAYDCFWIWITVAIGLACSFLVFVMELWLDRWTKWLLKRKGSD